MDLFALYITRSQFPRYPSSVIYLLFIHFYTNTEHFWKADALTYLHGLPRYIWICTQITWIHFASCTLYVLYTVEVFIYTVCIITMKLNQHKLAKFCMSSWEICPTNTTWFILVYCILVYIVLRKLTRVYGCTVGCYLQEVMTYELMTCLLIHILWLDILHSTASVIAGSCRRIPNNFKNEIAWSANVVRY